MGRRQGGKEKPPKKKLNGQQARDGEKSRKKPLNKPQQHGRSPE
jgi:hypothetical protein